MKNGYGYWLEQEKYDKVMGQARLQLNGIFEPLRMYGQNVYVDLAIEEVMHIIVQVSKAIRGKDSPIIIRPEYRRNTSQFYD